MTDANGIPLGITVAGANRHDSKLVYETLMSMPIHRPNPTTNNKQHLCMDAAYHGDEVAEIVEEFGYTMHLRPRGEEAKEIKRNARRKARRWVVERTHSWMNRFRGLLIRWSKKATNYLALLHLACAIITWRGYSLLG